MSGYRTIFVLSLLWFFGARIPHEVEGAFVNIVIGPFSSKQECEKYRSQAAEMIKMADGVITQCVSKEEI